MREPIAQARPRHPLVELTRARVVEFLREPEAVFWVFIFPVLLAVALGIAFRSRPPEKARVAVLADAPGHERIADLLGRNPGLSVAVLPEADAGRSLRTGKVDVIVVGTTEATSAPQVVYRFDPTRPEGKAARLIVDDVLQRALGRQDPARTSEEPVVEPGGRYIDFLIPGLVGLNLMGSGMWGLGFAVVQARTRKLLKRLAATPMRRSHYLLSFMVSRLIWLVLEVVVVIGAGWLLFGVTVHGSLLDLAVVATLGAASFAGLGLLVAARPQTIEGVSGWMNLVMLPMWLASGTFFSYERFPRAVIPVIRALPLTAVNDALRAVMNEGVSLSAVWSPVVVMVAWCVVSFGLALRLFRWQ